ncbi:FadR/GntR family transcriptional regulator [Streptomyces iranensis]|uniref:DNA-binding FadR family transcriptional regulator n=1 Tax=Streptomyces iranensis TaxID=576784 RepID=A0A061A3X2_9ACTN|nr:FCD domain-containing protein [Streptomyces iranensis]MBP2064957.1 DNA-binding FadR family transcriptional regulator [Streptomyces iranensis]CDR10099.1 GntR domain protein [Streptomyces iranensis]
MTEDAGFAGPADVSGQVRALIENGLRGGELAPGSRLPTERALAADLGTSRAAIRQALGALEREGVITRYVGRGTFVAPPSTARSDEPGSALQTSPAEIMATRLLIEPEIAFLAAQQATPADLAQIQRGLSRGSAAGTHEEFESWDSVLHREIAQAAHNGLLLRMFDTMNAARDLPVWGNIKRRSASPERRARYEAAHAQIVDALSDRDAEAARQHMRAHLLDVRANLLGHV